MWLCSLGLFTLYAGVEKTMRGRVRRLEFMKIIVCSVTQQSFKHALQIFQNFWKIPDELKNWEKSTVSKILRTLILNIKKLKTKRKCTINKQTNYYFFLLNEFVKFSGDIYIFSELYCIFENIVFEKKVHETSLLNLHYLLK